MPVDTVCSLISSVINAALWIKNRLDELKVSDDKVKKIKENLDYLQVKIKKIKPHLTKDDTEKIKIVHGHLGIYHVCVYLGI